MYMDKKHKIQNMQKLIHMFQLSKSLTLPAGNKSINHNQADE